MPTLRDLTPCPRRKAWRHCRGRVSKGAGDDSRNDDK